MSVRFDCFVSVVIRVANHEESVASFLREVHGVVSAAFANFEIIVVDDGSTDGTAMALEPLLKELPSLRVLRLMRSFGYEAAVAAGLDSAIGDYIVMLDVAVDPPALIPDFIAKARETNQPVFGVDRRPSGESMLYRTALKAFYSMSQFFLGVGLVENATGYMAFNRHVLNAITRIGDRQRFMRLMATMVCGGGVALPYERLTPQGRMPRKSLLPALGKAMTLLFQNSSRPLRLVSSLGLLASGVNLLYIGYIVAVVLFKRDVAEGWVTLSLQNAVMFFVINLTLAVVAEYVLRVMDETRDRPVYFLRDEQNSSVLIPAEDRRNVVQESQDAPLELSVPAVTLPEDSKRHA